MIVNLGRTLCFDSRPRKMGYVLDNEIYMKLTFLEATDLANSNILGPVTLKISSLE